ncbi:hypothetical protein T492DRAFT_886306 [Pavlovales sp. CCMP2436]|nr:hypothetical protein T492DRAFT_886306 [Pavlovales sp. CCMP2436]
MGDARQKWIVKAVAQAFDVPNLAVEECLREHSTQALLTGAAKLRAEEAA